ncbi:hypothetical protein GCM10022393_35560 [Aquimarina addita]|uniref:Tetratricopeptide repeat protein n=1 Tax=Aquimarina addita TaxID=870485 RepID=A0ABP6UTT9_9FLAO
MKIRFVIVFFLAISAVGFSQKQELKSAVKAVKSGQMDEAANALKAVEGKLDVADEKMKAQYYLLNGQVTSATAGDSLDQLESAAMSYLKVSEIEKASGSNKFTGEAETQLKALRDALVTKAIEDQKAGDNKSAAEKLYLGYKTNKKDTLYLYYAASNAVNAKEYDEALSYYNELVELGFDGNETQYVAINKETSEEEAFPSKNLRDISVKAGTHIKPEKKESGSKKSEITKNIVLIYVSQGKDEEAMKALELAKAENPDDSSLLQAEADMFYKLGNVEKYKEIMEQIVAKDPNNPDLLYNLGVSASRLGNNDKALEYYKRALELKPDYGKAQINVASLILGKETAIVDEMNALGTSSSDYKKYDALKIQREELYKSAIPYLEGALKSTPDNVDVLKTLKNIYTQLDDPKADEIKGKLEALEGGN